MSNVCLHAPRPPLELVSGPFLSPERWTILLCPECLSLWWLTLGCCVLWGWAHPFWLLWVKPAFVATLLNGQRWHVYFLHLCPVSQIPSSEGAARKSWGGRGTALDGSYLGLPLSGSRTDRGGSVECTHSFSTGPFSAPSSSDQNCETHVRHTNHNSEGGRSDLRFSNRDPPACDALRLHGTSEPMCSHQCHRMESDGMCGANQTGIAPLSGRENWEEKRRCLLLQKEQLEIERERIQARLVQQEEKLLLQNKQLHQSYLQYSK